ncbi:mechanosensitive ion channel family protein [Photobacterium rosenbergii]|uniref:Mechanosensitive ion channel n=1 Tax=Photobacterium rosenbergii TaxID=294936 RepID=A0ABU3ZKD3_9GAMM|nr:mechanosensitive ion channel domain-containing protein [Photobacterium rosenbergii]MDV5170584.1 mechanosensitive ion channel [Photobacterium rosenbergii]
MENWSQLADQQMEKVAAAFVQPGTYIQIGAVIVIYAVAYLIANRIRKYVPVFNSDISEATDSRTRQFLGKMGGLIFPILAIFLLRVLVGILDNAVLQGGLMQAALTVAVLLLFYSVTRNFIKHKLVARVFRWVGLPLLFLHMLGVLDDLITILDAIAIQIGSIHITAYAVFRLVIFGSLLFWLGRISSKTGREFISHQEDLDERTREVVAKAFEILIFFVVFMLILKIMGINLTTLAVFGGALGVGIGLGLQAIASNFISGVIILMDRSVSIGDFVELDDGRSGVVRELSMRSTTLETFDGKDIVVPNDKFITETFINWTHKDKRQRYRVDFSVAYHSDVRRLVEIIKEAVSVHPQVLSGDKLPIEERPDCEIDSFGDSGINMFVEFWMEGIDDGKNRVGGDLLLIILETIQEHGYEIPFPQREVRILNRE